MRTFRSIWRLLTRSLLALVVATTIFVPTATVSVQADSGDRTLYLYHTHTRETGRFTYKRNGKFDSKVLKQLNVFLADWRTKEPTTMDPALFDLLWLVYNEVGASQPINIVSSYRSPKTNAMLRSKSSAVAENSQHMKGKAMDFFIPGINLATLRATAMKYQVGGVGYYPTSGSPFVHLDTGSVRAWPRMTKAQLQKIFPDGKTLHLPTDGKPLSEAGRQYALAEWQQCHMVPCRASNGPRVLLASTQSDAPTPSEPKKTLVDMLFGDGDDEAEIAVQTASAPTQRTVETIDITAPVPFNRPTSLGGPEVLTASLDPSEIPFSTVGSAPLVPDEMDGDAPIPAIMSTALLAARGPVDGDSQSAVMAIASLDAPVPQSRVIMSPEVLTAYAPDIEPDPEAQRALEMIIARETAASLPDEVTTPDVTAPIPAIATGLRTASLEEQVGIGALSNLFDATFSAVANTGADATTNDAVASLAASQPLISVEERDFDLVMPDLDHVADVFGQPVSISGPSYAVLFDHDDGDFDKSTQLGAYVSLVGFETDPTTTPASDRFDPEAKLLLASN